MRAGVVEGLDRLADPDEHEGLRARLRLRRLTLRELADVEGRPLRPTRSPGVPVDHVPEREDELATDVRPHGDAEVAERREDRRLRRRPRHDVETHGKRDEVEDEGGQHERGVHPAVLPGLGVVGLVQVDEPGERGEDQARDAQERGHVRAVVDAEQIEDERDGQSADRHVGEERMERVPEPGAVQDAPEPRRPHHEAVDRRVEVGDPDAPLPLVEQLSSDEAPDHVEPPRRREAA